MSSNKQYSNAKHSICVQCQISNQLFITKLSKKCFYGQCICWHFTSMRQTYYVFVLVFVFSIRCYISITVVFFLYEKAERLDILCISITVLCIPDCMCALLFRSFGLLPNGFIPSTYFKDKNVVPIL
jgi:dolichol kinase